MTRRNKLGPTVAIGVAVGAVLGMIFHHLPVWLSLGCFAGIVIGVILTRTTRF